MTEAETRAAIRAFVAVGEVEHWIAGQPWYAAPGGWVVPEPFQGLRFRVEPVAGGVRIRAFMDNGEPTAWFVPHGGAQKKAGGAPRPRMTIRK